MFKFLKDIKELQEKSGTVVARIDNHRLMIDSIIKENNAIKNDIRSMSCFMHDIKSELDALKESKSAGMSDVASAKEGPQPGSGSVPIPPSS